MWALWLLLVLLLLVIAVVVLETFTVVPGGMDVFELLFKTTSEICNDVVVIYK